MKTTEKIDLAYYQKKLNINTNYGTNIEYYVESDKTQVKVVFCEIGYAIVKIRLKTFYSEIKEYHKNGILQKEGNNLYGSNIKIGIWREYDEQGNLIKETDYDKQFKDLCMKPNDVLRRLEEDEFIDRNTGKGQEKFRYTSDDYEINVDFTPSKKSKTILSPREPAKWYVTIYKDGLQTIYFFNAENCEFIEKKEQHIVD